MPIEFDGIYSTTQPKKYDHRRIEVEGTDSDALNKELGGTLGETRSLETFNAKNSDLTTFFDGPYSKEFKFPWTVSLETSTLTAHAMGPSVWACQRFVT